MMLVVHKRHCQFGQAMTWCLLLLLLLLQSTSSKAAEVSSSFPANDFTCPVTTECPVVCVQDAAECSLITGDCQFGTLCPDGTCQDVCDDSNNKNPCPAACGVSQTAATPPRVACKRTVDLYETCLAKYESYYVTEETCRKNAALDKGGDFNIAPPLTLFGLWVFCVTAATVIWCQRQRLHVKACTKPLMDENFANASHHDKNNKLPEDMRADGPTLTGYCVSPIGTAIYMCVVATAVLFQLLIFAFALASYTRDQKDSLYVFEVIWTVGFVWTFLYKWPYSVRSIFYKPTPLHLAEHVCIFTPATNPGHVEGTDTGRYAKPEARYILTMQAYMTSFAGCINAVMGTLFSVPARGPGTMIYVPVKLCQTSRRQPNNTTNNGAADSIKYFIYCFRRYNFDPELSTFVPGHWTVVSTLGDVVDALNSGGLTAQEVLRRLRAVGPNTIEMKEPSLWNSIFEEFSKPFYTYQNFILWTWVPLYYFYLTIIHGSVILTGGFTVAWFHYRNEMNLHTLTLAHGDAQVLRKNGTSSDMENIPQADLVPGDIIKLVPGRAYCDMIVVQSEGLLVDESALTGESTPMAKTAVDPLDREQTYSPLRHKKHVISAGTTIVESDEVTDNLAVVLNTGSFTSKGELLREVFSYERHQFKFDTEVGFVIGILFVTAMVGFVVVTMFIREQPVYAWFYGMYVVGTMLPPLLPTVFTVSVGISDNRLARKNIACSNSEDILVAGKVTKAFFDKTGTLTRQGLDFISAKCQSTWNVESHTWEELSPDLTMGMAVCHGLTVSNVSEELIGNPVDRTMFAATGATLSNNQGAVATIVDRMGNVFRVVKHFDFDHHRMTQSVIAVRTDGSMTAFVKGSGESLQRLCKAETLPKGYEKTVRESAKEGTYQISMGKKKLPPTVDLSTITRDEIESDLDFVGVINFKNVLRDETADVIRQLEAGEVQCIMVTGDSVLTGIRIAKESGLVKQGMKVILCTEMDQDGNYKWLDENDHEFALPHVDQLKNGSAGVELAVTGEIWEAMINNNPALAAEMAHAIRVYGRCTPFHKVSVVTTFVDMGYITLMCGDGGNDCGALKTAHVGVALSDAEASIVSPFTSLDKSITSVVEILKEGRCALASALASYKYIIMYGQIESMINVIGAYLRINFTEYCWFFMDGFWVIGMSFALPLAKAAKKLSPTRPTSSLLGPQTLASACGVLFFNVFFTMLALVVLFREDWFQCRKWKNTDVSNLLVIGDNYESETIFLVTGYQYISSAMAYNFGYEFRQGWFSNWWFVTLVTGFTIMHFWVTLFPGKFSCFWRVNCDNQNTLYSLAAGEVVPIQNPFHSTVMPEHFRWTLITIIITNAAVNMAWDYFVVNGIRRRAARKKRDKRNRLRLAPKKSSEGKDAAVV